MLIAFILHMTLIFSRRPMLALSPPTKVIFSRITSYCSTSSPTPQQQTSPTAGNSPLRHIIHWKMLNITAPQIYAKPFITNQKTNKLKAFSGFLVIGLIETLNMNYMQKSGMTRLEPVNR